MSHTRTANSRVLCIVATIALVSACGGPTPPSPPSPSPSPSPSPVKFAPPTITSVEPQTALTTGGAFIRINGTGFRNLTTLTVGGVKVSYNTAYPGTVDAYIYGNAPAHAPGVVDVTVTNDDGQFATLAGALTYLAIEDFDFNGLWEGGAVPDFYATPFQLTIERDHVVSFTCGTSGVITLDPAPLLSNGKFAYRGANGLAIDGVVRAPTEVDGTINAPSCEQTYWYADKK